MLWLAQPGPLSEQDKDTCAGLSTAQCSEIRESSSPGRDGCKETTQNTQSLSNGTAHEWEQDMFFPWFGNNVNTFSHVVGEALWHTCALGQLYYTPRPPAQLLRALFLSKNMD